MKTILIATDFSRASRNASVYGLHLAKAINANVILFSAYKVSPPTLTWGVLMPGYNAMEETQKRLLNEKEQLTYINMPRITTICSPGSATEEIIKTGNAENADFIITGMKGNGKSYKKLFGSTCVSLAKQTDIPLIVVPEDAKFKTPETLIFATDDKVFEQKNALASLKTIVQLLNCKLHIVKVVASRNGESFNIPPAFKTVMQLLGSSIEYLLDKDVTQGLNKFIQRRHAEMLIMMPHHHDRLERFFIKSETTDMIFHTNIPLLVLPEGQTKERSYSETYAGTENYSAY